MDEVDFTSVIEANARMKALLSGKKRSLHTQWHRDFWSKHEIKRIENHPTITTAQTEELSHQILGQEEIQSRLRFLRQELPKQFKSYIKGLFGRWRIRSKEKWTKKGVSRRIAKHGRVLEELFEQMEHEPLGTPCEWEGRPIGKADAMRPLLKRMKTNFENLVKKWEAEERPPVEKKLFQHLEKLVHAQKEELTRLQKVSSDCYWVFEFLIHEIRVEEHLDDLYNSTDPNYSTQLQQIYPHQEKLLKLYAALLYSGNSRLAQSIKKRLLFWHEKITEWKKIIEEDPNWSIPKKIADRLYTERELEVEMVDQLVIQLMEIVQRSIQSDETTQLFFTHASFIKGITEEYIQEKREIDALYCGEIEKLCEHVETLQNLPLLPLTEEKG